MFNPKPRFRITGLSLLACVVVIGCSNSAENKSTVSPAASSTEALESSVAYKGPLTIKVGGKYGYVDRSGKIVVNPQFDGAPEFSEGLANVCLGKCDFYASETKPDDSRYGFVDETGRYVVNPQFDYASPFSEGLAAVCSGDCGYLPVAPHKWGFIDKQGNMVIPLQFGRAYSFSEGLAPACVGKCAGANEKWEGKWGFIGKNGNFVIAPQFDDVGSFTAGIASATIGTGSSKKDGWIDKTGKFIWNPTD